MLPDTFGTLGSIDTFMKTQRTMKSKIMLAGALVVGLLLAYAFSSGPAVYMGERGVIPRRAIQVTYKPLLAVVGNTDAYHKYIRWWYDKGRS
jgi:hypothetical protein